MKHGGGSKSKKKGGKEAGTQSRLAPGDCSTDWWHHTKWPSMSTFVSVFVLVSSVCVCVRVCVYVGLFSEYVGPFREYIKLFGQFIWLF
mmetsp:Transcript_96924/g.141771  ORF Transcript_96924/g.141771 Transcript_96924/m.141771 type:complete len:89 (-) Transcript_96924:793-1059(-)